MTAKVAEAAANFERAKPLKNSGYVSGITYDQREAAAKTTAAQLQAAEDGLKLAEAEKKQVEAQRRELNWRLTNTKVTAPSDGLVSRRTTRIGGMASGAGEPMFRIVARGEVELDAEVIETELGKIAAGQKARVDVAGVGVDGVVRLVSPEVDKLTRLGRVRIFLGTDPRLRIGAFGARHRLLRQEPRARRAFVGGDLRYQRHFRAGRARRPRRPPRRRHGPHCGRSRRDPQRTQRG